jgi:TRAP-type C4-dicarboxylate transport system permease small subunit
MKLFWKFFDRTLGITVTMIYATLTILAFAQVLMRYVFGGALSWSEEAVRFLFIWLSFIGFSITMQRGGHISVQFIVDLFPKSFRREFLIFADVCILTFVIFFILKGTLVSKVTMANLSPAMHIPMGYIYLVFPISGGLLAINTLRVMVHHWKGPTGADMERIRDA